MVFWVSAALEVPDAVVDDESEFWTAVTGRRLPDHLVVAAATGAARVRVDPRDDDEVPPVPPAASFPGVRRTRVYQVCVDVPRPGFGAEAERWATLSGGRIEVLERRPEFAWLRVPGVRRPLDVLLQRLDRADGPVTAHLDVGTSDRAAEVRRHLALGATVLAEQEFWTVLTDPAGLAYCVTDRDPATGALV